MLDHLALTIGGSFGASIPPLILEAFDKPASRHLKPRHLADGAIVTQIGWRRLVNGFVVEAVLLIHGLVAQGWMMRPMVRSIRRHRFRSATWGYRRLSQSITAIAEDLRAALLEVDGAGRQQQP